MGTYLDGLIETRTAGGAWKAEVDLLGFDLWKARYARECLFGYGGSLGVERPLFDQRGWPEDACEEVPKECDELNHSHSYATWAEIAAVDWDAPLCDGPDGNRLGSGGRGRTASSSWKTWSGRRLTCSTRRRSSSARTCSRPNGRRAARFV